MCWATWRQVIDALRWLRDEKGMLVILLAHVKIEKFADPESTPFDRYSPRLNKNSSALLCEWSDAVLLATRQLGAAKGDKSGGQRIARIASRGWPSCGLTISPDWPCKCI